MTIIGRVYKYRGNYGSWRQMGKKNGVGRFFFSLFFSIAINQALVIAWTNRDVAPGSRTSRGPKIYILIRKNFLFFFYLSNYIFKIFY